MEPTRKPLEGALDLAARIQYLVEHDDQFRQALPLPAINEAKVNPELGLAQIMALCLEGYGGRAARPGPAGRRNGQRP